MSPAKKKEKALVELPPKNASNVALAPAPIKVSAAQKAVSANAKAFIRKTMKQSPIEEHKGVLPHLPSGSTIIDTLINGAGLLDDGQLVCPGYPRRHIVEIYGPESSGKTTVALSAVATAQRNGGVAMYLDTEHALDHRYARACGVQFNESLMLYQPDTMEQCFKMMLTGIIAGVDLVVVDSVASLVPAKELDKGLDDEAKIGAVASKMARDLPKFAMWLDKFPQDKGKKRADHPGTTIILLNQERSKIDTGGGKGKGRGGGGDFDPNTTGGKALKFYTYLRLRFMKYRTEKVERKDPATGGLKKFPYGTITKVQVVKTKVTGNAGHDELIFIRYGYGVDDLYSLIEVGAHGKAIVKEGAYYSFEGHRFQGRDKLRAFLAANPEVAERLRQLVVRQLMGGAQTIRDEDLGPTDEIAASFEAAMKDDDSERDEDDEDETPEEEIEADDAMVDDISEGLSEGVPED